MPPNCTLFPAIDLITSLDLEGSRCLDVGTAHGLTAFGMEKKGAEVVATDILETPSPGFLLAAEALDSAVEYQHNLPLRSAATAFGTESFDLVVCAGVMYHLLDPFDAIRVPRQLLKSGGYLLLETAFDPDSSAPTLTLNPTASPLIPDPYTYFLPSKAALFGMLTLFGFEIVGVRWILSPDRLAVLARSRSATERASQVPAQVARVWEVGFQDPLAAGDRWMPEPRVVADIREPGRLEPFELQLDYRTYRPDFPPHPNDGPDRVGRSAWSDRNTNR